MPTRRAGRRRALIIILLSTHGLPASPARGDEITLESLLREMVDREALTRLPAPAYRLLQASSYDRKSTVRDGPGWFANVDTGQYLRSEVNDGRKESVMLDAAGPGAVVRWWAGGTTPETGPPGTIRIYLDGNPRPAFEGLMDTLVSPDWKVGPPLAATRCIGRNFYLPIPFARGCKITYDRPGLPESNDWSRNAHWYVIDYRLYATGTAVRSFSLEDLDRAKGDLARAQQELADPSRAAPGAESRAFRLAPGGPPERWARDAEPGGGAIEELSLTLRSPDPAQALRSMVITIEFDGERTVWCPVGDFFGEGVGPNAYRDWWRTVEKAGRMSARWVMPYREGCALEIQNLGAEPVEGTIELRTGSYAWSERSLHFHAAWRQETGIETKKEDGLDWNYVTINGEGLYAGDTLALHNGAGPWWGEGDEKIFVDGESFPSHFGTGTEDYYGYSYGDRGTFFEGPFHAEPRWEGNDRAGFVTVTRSRSLDAIPFSKRLEFEMEIWHWARTKVTYAAATYFYARPGARTNRAPQPEEARRPIEELRNREKGLLEGEELKILARTGGVTEIQRDGRWSGGAHLWWRDGALEDRLELEIPVAVRGKYEIRLRYTTAFDYGRIQLSLDGKDLGGPLDGYSKQVEVHDADLGPRDLAAGPHVLACRIVGSSPEAKPRHMLGLDFVRLVAAK